MRTTAVTLALLCVATIPMSAQDSTSDDAAIRKPVADYNRGLNTCDVESAVKAWERDGVFMPPNQPAVEGEQALRSWYKNYCSRTVANLKFAPVEARRIGDWAWLRVAISGTTTSKSTGMVTQQDNKARFSSCTVQPTAHGESHATVSTAINRLRPPQHDSLR
jgi:ketosteroid isomerase-like protein